ncbi:MAG: hypothetical protein ABEH83_01960 [Halobacterium sp.]
MTSTRERLGWALLFGLPVGVGIGLAVVRMRRVPFTDPFVLGTVAGATLLVGGLVFVAASANQGGEPRPSAE